MDDAMVVFSGWRVIGIRIMPTYALRLELIYDCPPLFLSICFILHRLRHKASGADRQLSGELRSRVTLARQCGANRSMVVTRLLRICYEQLLK